MSTLNPYEVRVAIDFNDDQYLDFEPVDNKDITHTGSITTEVRDNFIIVTQDYTSVLNTIYFITVYYYDNSKTNNRGIKAVTRHPDFAVFFKELRQFIIVVEYFYTNKFIELFSMEIDGDTIT